MKRVTGIGGVFFKSPDPQRLAEWYRFHIGFNLEEWGRFVFSWAGPDNPTGTGTTVWNAFKDDTDHLGSGRSFMFNYQVDDLYALLAALRAEGCQVEDKVDESEFGKLGWIRDVDGNRVELWEPPAGR